MTSEARHIVDLPAGRVAWRGWGAHGPVVVLLHGVGLNADVWLPQAAALASDHRVIAIDLPGHGASTPLPAGAGLDAFAAQVLATMAQVAEAPALLAGHSMGALVALSAALAAPERLRGVAALNAVHCRTPEARAAARSRADILERVGPAATIQPTIARWFGPQDDALHEAQADTLRAMLEDADPAGYARAYRLFAEGDRALDGRLAQLATPALFLTGAEDPNSTPAMSRAMAAEAPQGEAVIVPGARHMAGFVTPAPVNAALRDFSARTTKDMEATR